MASSTQSVASSRKMVLAGRIISVLCALFLLFDAIIKVLRAAPAVEGTVRLGYPVVVVVAIGVTLLLCVVLYLIPRTSYEPQDHGFMYGHGFQDLDGHIWELAFREPSAIKEQA